MPVIFREREKLLKNRSQIISRNVQYWPKILSFLLKDQGQLHIHAKEGIFPNTVMSRTDFTEEMTPLRRQKSQVYAKDLQA